MTTSLITITVWAVMLCGYPMLPAEAGAVTYPVVDSGQDKCYNATQETSPPASGQAFYGQDAQYTGNQPSYALSGDGLTVYDNVTGLTWVRTPDTDGDSDLDSYDKLTWTEFQDYPTALNAQNFAGYDDWRNPTIKELYSLIDFRGLDPSGGYEDTLDLVPYIDTNYFDFVYGDESAGERQIDAQYWSATEYVGTVFGGEAAVFGLNFADGRIKGYPRDSGPGGTMTEFARCVRGGTAYGINAFIDNGDGTVTDQATGLMWMKYDSGVGYDWEDALDYAENLVYAGCDDWRLPNAKELQSIVDYTRSPSTTGTPAIDPAFDCTPITDEGGGTNYPFYWTSTTHAAVSPVDPGGWACYVCFGEGLGWMGEPFPPPPTYELQDVHGAGAQRCDPKSGDPGEYPYGHGPQGDVVRIFNYVRAVRDADADAGCKVPATGSGMRLETAPNPFASSITISFFLTAQAGVNLSVYDPQGRPVADLLREVLPAGRHTVTWDAEDMRGCSLPAGIYFLRVQAGGQTATAKALLAR